MASKSNLGEVTLALRQYYYEFLSEVLPEGFTSNSQVIVSNGIDQKTDFYTYMRVSNLSNKEVSFPFAAITRETNPIEVESGRGIPSTNYSRYTYFNSNYVDNLNKVKTWKFLPVKLSYHIRVYDKSINNIERLTERVLFGVGKSTSLNLVSDILNEGITNPSEKVSQMINIINEESPVQGNLLEEDDRSSSGYIYVLNLNPKVFTSLGYRGNDSSIILKAMGNIYSKSDVPDEQILLDTVTVTEPN